MNTINEIQNNKYDYAFEYAKFLAEMKDKYGCEHCSENYLYYKRFTADGINYVTIFVDTYMTYDGVNICSYVIMANQEFVYDLRRESQDLLNSNSLFDNWLGQDYDVYAAPMVDSCKNIFSVIEEDSTAKKIYAEYLKELRKELSGEEVEEESPKFDEESRPSHRI